MSKEAYFEWIRNCGLLLEATLEEQGAMVEDVNWHSCYEDGMSPEQAVTEFLAAPPHP